LHPLGLTFLLCFDIISDLTVPTAGSSDEKKLYFEMLQLHPVRLNVSVVSTVTQLPVSKDGKPIEKPAHAESAGYRFIQALGVSLGNIDSVTLSLNALIIPHPFVTQRELISRIAQHYKYQLLRQVWKVLLTFDVLGSPLSLISSMGTGVYDFFYDPYKSFVNSPSKVMQGIATGTYSLIRQSMYGVTNSTSKLTRSVEKAIAKATPGSEKQWQEQSLRYMTYPRNSLSLVGVGVTNLASSLIGSAAGLLSSPFQGWKRSGATGMVGGLVNGVLDVGLRYGQNFSEQPLRLPSSIN
jgi:vacuolar protein sorting-associated protein 13A/C